MKKIGRYDILEEVGRGATGVVYMASDPAIGRVVALKVLALGLPSVPGAANAREIFMREARAAGGLSHRGIVAIHDVLDDPETQSTCIVMEYVPGLTLERVLTSERLGTERALEIARQVAEALDYAHGRNVIHRDLKPANVILTEDGQTKLTDFGIAKVTAREGALRTLSVMGTPSYMSPEQVSSGEVDGRSDLFSLGVLLYLMLTGEKPFEGETAAVLYKIAYEDPVLPSKVNLALSPAHDYIVLRCLAKNPSKRYSSAREFLDDLEDIRKGRPPRGEARIPVAELRVGEPTLTGLEAAGKSAANLLRGLTRKTAWIGAGAGGGVLLLVSLLGFWISHHHSMPAQPIAAAKVAPPSPPLPIAPSPAPPVAAPSPSMPAPTPSSKAVKEAKSLVHKGKKVAATPAPKIRAKAPAKAGKPPKAAVQPTAVTTVSIQPHLASPATASLPATSSSAKVVKLICKHDLGNATLVVSSSSHIISRWPLKGKKRFLGIKGGRRGTLSDSVTIPGDAHELSVRVVSADGSFDRSKQIAAVPPQGASPTLEVDINSGQLNVSWQ